MEVVINFLTRPESRIVLPVPAYMPFFDLLQVTGRQRVEISMFVRNCWCMAGWSRDFGRDELKPVTMLDEQIVIYRKNDGGLVALQDRCCHRLAPLSLGRIENDDLRCMYHGMKFAPTGRCIEIPGQSKIPPQACVRAYPIADKYSGAWVWMGKPALADESLIPEFVGRLPVVATLDELDEAALIQILTEPKNALLKQYQKMFSMEGVELEVRSEALRAVAHRALARRTGARGLRSILEGALLDIMFDLPSLSNVRKVVMDEGSITGDQKPLLIYSDQPKVAGSA